MDGQLSIARLVLDASFVVQVVLLLLLGASLTSWTIIFRKRGDIGRSRKDADRFEESFWASNDLAALYRGADTVIFDEPTAVLAPHEARALFDVMRRMRDAGSTIVLITHEPDVAARVWV